MKPKILMVCCDGFENGGIQAVIMSITRSLSDKYCFDAISFTDGEQHYSREFLKQGNIYHFKKYKAKNPIAKLLTGFFEYKFIYKQAKAFFNEHNDYIAIHCHNYHNAAPIIKAAKKANIKIRVAHSHNVASPIKLKNPFHYLFNYIKKLIINKYATSMVACSKSAGEYLFGKNKTLVINNAINLDYFNPSNYEEVTDKTTRFVHVGRYCYQKNQLFLLDVFNEYSKLDNNATLTLVGFGEWESKIRSLIDEYNLQDKVTMLASDSCIPKVYSQCNATIFPSNYEGLGISLIEAQAMGIRCYVSEVIQPEADLGLCTFLQLDWGAKKWAEIIYQDIQNNPLKKQFVNTDSYDINIIKNQYDEIYSENN